MVMCNAVYDLKPVSDIVAGEFVVNGGVSTQVMRILRRGSDYHLVLKGGDHLTVSSDDQVAIPKI